MTPDPLDALIRRRYAYWSATHRRLLADGAMAHDSFLHRDLCVAAAVCSELAALLTTAGRPIPGVETRFTPGWDA